MDVRKQTLIRKLIFSIVSLIDKSNKFEDSYYKIGDELREFDNVGLQPKQRIWEPSQADTRQPGTDGSRSTKRKGDWKTMTNQQKAQICFKIISLSEKKQKQKQKQNKH